MNKFKTFFYCAIIVVATSYADVSVEVPISVAIEVEGQQVDQDERAEFLQKFPQLAQCTVEQQEEAFAFYQDTQKIQSLLKEASQAVEDLNAEAAQNKVAQATEMLKHLAE